MSIPAMKRTYKVVDVFSATPLLGNPVGVVLDAEGLDSAAMQEIARWTNISETTFLLPPTVAGADYALRIFTPRSELPFAGHPTLGSAHAALEAGRIAARGGRLVQECGVGLVTLEIAGNGAGNVAERRLTLDLPPATVTPLTPADVDELEQILGAPVRREAAPAIIHVGAVWGIAQLADAAQILKLTPDLPRSVAFERRLGLTGITVFGRHAPGDLVGDDAAIEVRTFAPSGGIDEDPVCGSGNGSVAVFQHARGLLPKMDTSYIATQGRCVGRAGRIAVDVAADGKVRIGGACVTTIDGTLNR